LVVGEVADDPPGVAGYVVVGNDVAVLADDRSAAEALIFRIRPALGLLMTT